MRIAFFAALLLANFSFAQPKVYKAQITPNWFNDNSRFWYRNDLSGGRREVILVDAVAGSRQLAFDHQRLATALHLKADQLPFNSIEFVDDGNAIRFSVGDVWWKCALRSYECTKTTAAPAPPATQSATQVGQRFRQGRAARGNRSPRSGDGKFTVFVKDHNIFL